MCLQHLIVFGGEIDPSTQGHAGAGDFSDDLLCWDRGQVRVARRGGGGPFFRVLDEPGMILKQLQGASVGVGSNVSEVARDNADVRSELSLGLVYDSVMTPLMSVQME
eukprot:scaffold149341_cov16-Tisochrysis_lutea.AAC.1